MEEERIKSLMRMVEAEVRRRYGRHDQIEDVLSAAYLGMWQSLVTCRETGACKPETAAKNGALWAAAQWMRSPQNNRRVAWRSGRKLPALYSLDLLEGHDEIAGEREASATGRRLERWEGALPPTAPDHSERVVEEIDTRLLIEKIIARAGLSPEDWEIVRRTVMEGEEATTVAEALGMSHNGLLKRRRHALARLKAAAMSVEEGETTDG